MELSARTAALKAIKDEVLNLTTSPLYSYRRKEGFLPVIGEGSHLAKIMLIGEAPGRTEAKTGRPFCGAAGKILDDLLLSIGLPRTQVYITNIVKDRPPGNRDPQPEEITCYGPFLDRQIEILEPKVIVTLGRFSLEYIFRHFQLADALRPISVLHGRLFTAPTPYGQTTILPLYHPAAAIYNRELKTVLLSDIRKLTNFL